MAGQKRGPLRLHRVYLIRPISGRAELRAHFVTHEQHPVVRHARSSEKGRKLEWFFQAPVWELVTPEEYMDQAQASANGHLCAAYDLRFTSLVLDRGVPFRYKFRVRNGMAEPLGWQ